MIEYGRGGGQSPARRTIPCDGECGLIIFTDDDAAYLQWVKQHPLGYVLNATRPPLPDFLVLHLASCRAVYGEPSVGDYWTAESVKVCSTDRAEIEAWAQNEVGGQVMTCELCHP